MTVSLILNDLEPLEAKEFSFLHEMIKNPCGEYLDYYIQSILFIMEMLNTDFYGVESIKKKFADAYRLITEIDKELSEII